MTAMEKKEGQISELYELAESFVWMLGVQLVVSCFFLRTATVDGGSMFPTLEDRENLLLQVAGCGNASYGDILVVNAPDLAEKVIIKRVVGLAGDTIEIDFDTGEVRRNGELLDEPYINEPTWTWEGVDFPVQVPEGHLFVLGDNRNHSKDSRSPDIGMVDVREIIGRAFFRLTPFARVGSIN